MAGTEIGMKKLGRAHRKGTQSLLATQYTGAEECKTLLIDREDSFVQTSIGDEIRSEIEARFLRSKINASYVFPRAEESVGAKTTGKSALLRREEGETAGCRVVRTKSNLRLKPKTPAEQPETRLLRPLPRRKLPPNLSFFQPKPTKSRPIFIKKASIKGDFRRITNVPFQSKSSFRRKSNLSTTFTDSLSTSFAGDYLDSSTTNSSVSQYLQTINRFLI